MAPIREHLLREVVPAIAEDRLTEGTLRELGEVAAQTATPEMVASRTAATATRLSEQQAASWYAQLARATNSAVLVQSASGLGAASDVLLHGGGAASGIFLPPGVEASDSVRQLLITATKPGIVPLDAAAESARLISLTVPSVREATAEAVRRARREGQTAQELAEVLKREWEESGVPSFMPTRQLGPDGLPVLTSLETHATLVAQDQIAKVAASENAQQQADSGVTHFRWITQGDGRVRTAHAALNGRVFSWSNGADGDYPGQAVRCRCTAEPVVDLEAIREAPNVIVRDGPVTTAGAPRETVRAEERALNLREFRRARRAAQRAAGLESGDYLNVLTGRIESAT